MSTYLVKSEEKPDKQVIQLPDQVIQLPDKQPIYVVDPLTVILFAPFYILQAILTLPVLFNMLANQRLIVSQPQYPKMIITEVVRDEQGRIMQVIERVL